jgi:hypothetical protein
MFKLVNPRWDPVLLHDWFNLVVIAILNVQNLTYLATGACMAACTYAWRLSICMNVHACAPSTPSPSWLGLACVPRHDTTADWSIIHKHQRAIIRVPFASSYRGGF